MLIAVNFHYIRDSFEAPYPSIFGVTPQQFILQLEELSKAACFLSIDDIIDIINGKRTLPEKAVIITFDDGLKEQYELAWPILKRKGIPAIFYVNTRPIEDNFVTTTHEVHLIRSYTQPEELVEVLYRVLAKVNLELNLPCTRIAQTVYKYDSPEDARLKYFLNYMLDEKHQELVVDRIFQDIGFDQARISNDLYMDKSMITELAKSGCLGTHGHSHRPLGLLDDGEALDDFEKSVNKIQNWTGQTMQTLSYPFGFKKACSQVVAAQAEKYGIKFAFTMERSGNNMIDAPMFMSRFSNNDVPGGKNCPNHLNFWHEIPHAKWFRNGVDNEKK